MTIQTAPTVDYATLLPHFTGVLALELQVRLYTRVLEDTDDLEFASTRYREQYREEKVAEVKRSAWSLAGKMVNRIFRTQMAEALALISFSDAMIQHGEKMAAVKDEVQSKLKAAARGEVPKRKATLDEVVTELRGKVEQSGLTTPFRPKGATA